jgi:hypothetical protein
VSVPTPILVAGGGRRDSHLPPGHDDPHRQTMKLLVLGGTGFVGRVVVVMSRSR